MLGADNTIFSSDRYAATRAPIEDAAPLPPDVYFSQEWYDREIETIFRTVSYTHLTLPTKA